LKELKIFFSYDHTSGLFFARLENGARFPVAREEISGKLSNNLSLFRRAVIHQIEGRPAQSYSKAELRETLRGACEGVPVTVYNRPVKTKVDLNELEIDI
jgi:hypothetical protein